MKMIRDSAGRSVSDYLSLPYSFHVMPDDDGFYVEIEEIPSVCGSGKTLHAAYADARKCQEKWLADAIKSGSKVPEPLSLREFNGQFALRMPRSLHRAIAEEAEYEGVSMNQYLNILITENRYIRAIQKNQQIETLPGAGVKTHTTTDEYEEEDCIVIDMANRRAV